MKYNSLHKLFGSFLVIVLFVPTKNIAQTYIGPIFGLNLSYLEGEKRCTKYERQDQFTNNSIFAGLKIEQSLSDKLKLGFNVKYTTKKIKYDWTSGPFDCDFCDSTIYRELNYKQLNSALVLSYNLVGNWYLNAGISGRYYFDGLLNSEKTTYKTFPVFIPEQIIYDPQLNFDWTFGTSFLYKNFLFEINYSQSILKKEIWNPDPIVRETDMYHKSLDLTVAYLFNISNVFKKKAKVNCPKM